jgi:hypothetical protein
MDDMNWDGEANAALMMVTGKNGPPTLAEAAAQLGLEIDAFDPDFGVVTIDLDRNLYSVRVDASKIGDDFDAGKGPFSDPRIDHFGSPKK